MKLFKTIKEFFSTSTTKVTKVTKNILPDVGFIFSVKVETKEAIESDKTLGIFLNKISERFGFSLTEIYFTEDSVFFYTYDDETNDKHRSELYDANKNIREYLGDVVNGIIPLSEVECYLKYQGICN